jgi:hypothetical protein
VRSIGYKRDYYNYRGEDEAALRKLSRQLLKSLPEQLTLEGFFCRQCGDELRMLTVIAGAFIIHSSSIIGIFKDLLDVGQG